MGQWEADYQPMVESACLTYANEHKIVSGSLNCVFGEIGGTRSLFYGVYKNTSRQPMCYCPRCLFFSSWNHFLNLSNEYK